MTYGEDSSSMMDEESAPSTAESAPPDDSKEEKSDETEDQLALVPTHFFKNTPKPGMRETVEVVSVYENEVSLKCVYGDEDKEEKDEGDTPGKPASDDEDDSMMA
jgi:hypothetical protein